MIQVLLWQKVQFLVKVKKRTLIRLFTLRPRTQLVSSVHQMKRVPATLPIDELALWRPKSSRMLPLKQPQAARRFTRLTMTFQPGKTFTFNFPQIDPPTSQGPPKLTLWTHPSQVGILVKHRTSKVHSSLPIPWVHPLAVLSQQSARYFLLAHQPHQGPLPHKW